MAEEDPAVEKAEDKPTIENVAALSDEQLSKLLGLDQQLKEAKKALQDMKSLTGKAREYAEERIEKMFTPHIYPSEFKYIKEDAERHAKKKDAKQAICDCDPCSVM